MERRDFLKFVLGAAAGAAALVASAQAAPLMPQPLDAKLPVNPDAEPAVTSSDEVDRLTPEEVRWGRRRGWGRRWGYRRRWYRRRRFWGYRRRRYWGWRRRRRRYWRRRYYRRRYW